MAKRQTSSGTTPHLYDLATGQEIERGEIITSKRGSGTFTRLSGTRLFIRIKGEADEIELKPAEIKARIVNVKENSASAKYLAWKEAKKSK